MRNFLFRFINLIWGLFLFAVGIVLTMKANIGFAPWDVLHSGLSERTGISFGTISILIGLLICVLVVLLGEKLGLGTVLNGSDRVFYRSFAKSGYHSDGSRFRPGID